MINDNYSNSALDDEVSLKELIFKFKDWWRFLWSKKIIIIIAGIIGGGLGLTYAFFKKPIYTATTTFVLEAGEKGGASQYAGIASMIGIDLGGGGGIFQGDNIMELYKSRLMIEKTLLSPVEPGAKELLIDRYLTFSELRKSWEKKPKLSELTFSNFNLGNRAVALKNLDSATLLKDSVLFLVSENIRKSMLSVTKPDKKLSVIKVDVTALDPVFAKNFNDELVKNVNTFYVETKTKKMVNNVVILQHKTDSVTAVMNGNIYSAVAILDATPNLNPTRQVQRVAPAQRAQFSSETNKMVLTELMKNLEMSKITLLKETPLIQVVDYPIYPLKKQGFGKLKGLVFGGFIAGFLMVILLILKRQYNIIIA